MQEPEGDVEQPKVSPPPSNFTEGTQIQWSWDATSLSAFLKCPRYYKLAIIDGYRGDSIHLRWGSEFHMALEDYDRSRAHGVNHDDSIHDTIRALLERIADWEPEPETKSEELKTKPNLLRSVVWYLDHYHPDKAETLVLQNGAPAVELSFNFPLEWGPTHQVWSTTLDLDKILNAPEGTPPGIPYHLCGYLDRVVVFNDDLYVMDRKTTTSTPGSYYFDRFDLDTQMTLYTLAGQIILKSPIKGVIVDVIQVAVGFTRPVRGFTVRTPDQLEDWLEQLRWWLEQAETCAIRDVWPQNLTSCDKYGGCDFRSVCSKSPSVQQKFLEGSFKGERRSWNPLEPRGPK